MTKLLDIQSHVIKTASENQINTDTFNIEQRVHKKGTEMTQFPVGSFVLVQYENDDRKAPSKIDTKLRGPMKIISVEGSTYTLQDMATNKKEDFLIHLIRPFDYDPLQVDPEQTAYKDKGFAEILQVDEHKYIGKVKMANLHLLILFKGDKKPIWQQWNKSFKHNLKVHEYLNDNKMTRFVPKQYKN